MHNMTEQQIKEYLVSPNTCPFCGSKELNGDSFDVSGNSVIQPMECLRCHEEWTDEHTLTGVI